MLPLIAVVGATATGKSELAIEAALHFDGEVINGDAMQFYRGMDIGTAKVTREEMRGVPHHLFDLLSVREEASVADYQRLAREKVAEVRARGKLPIVVGGSGLYVRALLDRIEFPGTDRAVRERFEQYLEKHGEAALRELLRERDPQAAEAIQDPRRMVRALEVHEVTGKPYTFFLPRYEYHDPATLQIGIRRPRPELHERVALRVERMYRDGLLEETRRLLGEGLAEGRTASRAIGYAQAMEVLSGSMAEADAIARTTVLTRKLVRKQDTWFGRDDRITWYEAENKTAVLERIARDVA
ncbi:tRNA (adenosine(37)-N6)-dimethylallyltransferase MiaA [Dermabacteraceae bacterium P13264]